MAKKSVEPNIVIESFINGFIHNEITEGIEQGFIESKD